MTTIDRLLCALDSVARDTADEVLPDLLLALNESQLIRDDSAENALQAALWRLSATTPRNQ